MQSPFCAWLARSKDQWTTLQSIASIIALVIGAIWVLANFDMLSEWNAEISLEQAVKAYKVSEDATLLQVDVILKSASKRSATFHCLKIEIIELLPLTEANVKKVEDGLGLNKNFDYENLRMKAMHMLLNNDEGLIVAASSATAFRTYWSVSPKLKQYEPSIRDPSTTIKSVIVRSGFYEQPDCKQKLDKGKNLIKHKEITSIFDMETNTTAPLTQQTSSP